MESFPARTEEATETVERGLGRCPHLTFPRAPPVGWGWREIGAKYNAKWNKVKSYFKRITAFF